ncbi:TetR/AcrR family transcriptional regulator [Geodermatophilus africanus]|uniref:TetR/AcrR family transcriptional regulator n=1 Tax=Geodermatophilus africanus TaxID=1137993 RepID=UPI00147CED79|nr:TetR/AcrR family transcriptional regulator [Geodermatophilus africanus]
MRTAGRPRLEDRRRPGHTAREEVLDAAGELFTTRGYAATSTRRIAEAVGIRQASLYHYFRTKDDILEVLLSGTVTRPLSACAHLMRMTLRPAVRLHALTLLDSRQLWDGPWNLGILYLLPEVRTERFARFHRARDDLRNRYRELSRAVVADLPPPAPDVLTADPDDDVVFRLTETLPNLRADGLGSPDQPVRTADLALHALGWRGDWAQLRSVSRTAGADVAAAAERSDDRAG